VTGVGEMKIHTLLPWVLVSSSSHFSCCFSEALVCSIERDKLRAWTVS
jgi:hypothetical protein